MGAKGKCQETLTKHCNILFIVFVDPAIFKLSIIRLIEVKFWDNIYSSQFSKIGEVPIDYITETNIKKNNTITLKAPSYKKSPSHRITPSHKKWHHTKKRYHRKKHHYTKKLHHIKRHHHIKKHHHIKLHHYIKSTILK